MRACQGSPGKQNEIWVLGFIADTKGYRFNWSSGYACGFPGNRFTNTLKRTTLGVIQVSAFKSRKSGPKITKMIPTVIHRIVPDKSMEEGFVCQH